MRSMVSLLVSNFFVTAGNVDLELKEPVFASGYAGLSPLME